MHVLSTICGRHEVRRRISEQLPHIAISIPLCLRNPKQFLVLLPHIASSTPVCLDNLRHKQSLVLKLRAAFNVTGHQRHDESSQKMYDYLCLRLSLCLSSSFDVEAARRTVFFTLVETSALPNSQRSVPSSAFSAFHAANRCKMMDAATVTFKDAVPLPC